MKFGCLGCLGLLLVLGVVLLGGALALLFGGSIFEVPALSKPTYSASDGYRAQDKLFEIVLRDSGRSPRRDPVVITDEELNAFLAAHLQQKEGLPISPLVVKLSSDTVEVRGQTAFKNLFKGFPFYFLPDRLPASTMDRPVWVTVRGTIWLDRETSRAARKYGRLEVKEFTLGNQDMGAWLLSLLLGQERLRWEVPAIVEAIKIQDGRMLIYSAK